MPFNRLMQATFYPPKYWRIDRQLAYTPTEITHEQVRLLKSFSVSISEQTFELTVPKNFLTDLASIPRFAWWLIAPFEVSRAAVVHDYLYRQLRQHSKKDSRARAAADAIFLQAMEEMEPPAPAYKRYLAYWAVRMFGWFAVRKSQPVLPDARKYQ